MGDRIHERLKTMKSITAFTAAVLALAAFAEKIEPEIGEIKDSNPFATYEACFAPDQMAKSAAEWQKAEAAAIEKATSKEVLAAIVGSDEAIRDLLGKVKDAYATDPIVATQIAAISELVMCTKCDKAPACRARWTAALVDAAVNAPDAYRKMFFLDQLRWCGRAEDKAGILSVAHTSSDAAVREFAVMVMREISCATRKCGSCRKPCRE
jgi:hypothetical protein